VLPAQVGDTKLYYSFTAADQYYFNLVISNTRVPVADVAVVIQGKRITLTRSTNNNWAYHNSDGAYTFPMEVTITPVCGKAVRPAACRPPEYASVLLNCCRLLVLTKKPLRP
jgi:hypothetical protein